MELDTGLTREMLERALANPNAEGSREVIAAAAFAYLRILAAESV